MKVRDAVGGIEAFLAECDPRAKVEKVYHLNNVDVLKENLIEKILACEDLKACCSVSCQDGIKKV